jgi:hypothetical protein
MRNARRAWFNPAATSIGLSGLTSHELRHTAASISADANVKAVQRILGHASAAMTLDFYTDLFDDDLDTVADRLDATRNNSASRSRRCPQPGKSPTLGTASLRSCESRRSLSHFGLNR